MSFMNALKLFSMFGPALQGQQQATTPYNPEWNQPAQAGLPTVQAPAPFNPVDYEPPVTAGLANFGQEQYDPYARLAQMYQPETRASDMYYQMLSEFPQREQPGFMRKLSASLMAGGGNFAGAERALYGDYQNDVRDYITQMNLIGNAANQERYSNANERAMATTMMRDERAGQRIDLAEEKLKRETEHKERQYQLQKRNIELKEWALQNPEHRFKEDENGEIIGFNPRNPLDYVRTGIRSGELDPYLKMQLGFENRLELLNRSHELAMSKIDKQRESDIEEAKAKAEIKSEVGGEGMSPSQRKVHEYNRAREFMTKNPKLSRYIVLGNPGTNDFKIKRPVEPDSWTSGPTPEEHKQITEFIYGDSEVKTAPFTPGGTTTNPPTNTGNKSGASAAPPTGWKWFERPDGTGTKVLMQDIAKAKAKGYKEISAEEARKKGWK